MTTIRRTMLLGLTVGTLLAWTTRDVAAQCSRGGGPTGSRGGLSMLSANPANMSAFATRASQSEYGTAQMLVMQQAQQRQRQAMAMRMQRNQQAAQQRYAAQQELLAMRRERATQTRAKRAERIAIAKAKREVQQAGPAADESRSLYAAQASPQPNATQSNAPEPKATRLASVNRENPFGW